MNQSDPWKLNNLEPWQLGYIAGMVDAECHIGLQRQIQKNGITPCYAVRFELAMVDIKPIQFINRLLPFSKIVRSSARGRRLPVYRLRVIQQQAIAILRAVYPYVQGKKRQIEICFEVDRLRRLWSPSQVHIGFAHFRQMPPEFEQTVFPLFQEFRSLQLNKKPRK